jgi:hypothetical protein
MDQRGGISSLKVEVVDDPHAGRPGWFHAIADCTIQLLADPEEVESLIGSLRDGIDSAKE